MQIEARLTVTTTEEGGRRHGIYTGFRAPWRLEDGETLGTGTVSLQGESAIDADGRLLPHPDEVTRWLPPGETEVVRVHPLVAECWSEVVPGDRIEMLDGGVAARAVVLNVE